MHSIRYMYSYRSRSKHIYKNLVQIVKVSLTFLQELHLTTEQYILSSMLYV